MIEHPDLGKIDIMSLSDLENLLFQIDTINNPNGIAIMRRYLMRKTKNQVAEAILDSLKLKIITPSVKTMSTFVSDTSKPYKFVREGERIIIFSDSRQDKDNKIMHIHYALAAGMYLPEDGGSLAYLPMRNAFELSGNSSSLHIPPTNNPARQVSIETLRPSIPSGIKLNVPQF